jgi:ribonucleotide reductase alpha subunit
VQFLRQIKKAWSSGRANKLVKVMTDQGLEFTCTPEHRFYLRDGQAVEAKNLELGAPLRKIDPLYAGAPSTNDQVASVTTVTSTEEVKVYDIEVEGIDNFGITSVDAEHDVIVPNSEFMDIDDLACNLAGINLMKFRNDDGSYDVEGFQQTVRIFITTQAILVDFAGYPTARIYENSQNHRPLTLGYANLGALIMSYGLPHDSIAARQLCSVLTSIMHGTAYLQSAEISLSIEPFAAFEFNKEPMLGVIAEHARQAHILMNRYYTGVTEPYDWKNLKAISDETWNSVRDPG